MKSTLIFMLLVLATADEFDNPFDVLGDSVPTRLDAYTQLISDAQHNPNATRSVGFKPFRAATEASSALALRDAEWIWREYITLATIWVRADILRRSRNQCQRLCGTRCRSPVCDRGSARGFHGVRL